MRRCHEEKHKSFPNYGGRGIKVCERWWVLEDFIKDAGEMYRGRELDRIDNDKGYSPSNVRWVSKRENNRNKRTNVMLTLSETKCVMAWADELGIHDSTIRSRLKRGWSVEEALLTMPGEKRIPPS